MKDWVPPRKAKFDQGVRYHWVQSFRFEKKNETFKD